jgi:hypothetical protein
MIDISLTIGGHTGCCSTMFAFTLTDRGELALLLLLFFTFASLLLRVLLCFLL